MATLLRLRLRLAERQRQLQLLLLLQLLLALARRLLRLLRQRRRQILGRQIRIGARAAAAAVAFQRLSAAAAQRAAGRMQGRVAAVADAHLLLEPELGQRARLRRALRAEDLAAVPAVVLALRKRERHATATAHLAVGPIGRRFRREHGVRLLELGEGVTLLLQNGHDVPDRLVLVVGAERERPHLDQFERLRLDVLVRRTLDELREPLAALLRADLIVHRRAAVLHDALQHEQSVRGRMRIGRHHLLADGGDGVLWPARGDSQFIIKGN